MFGKVLVDGDIVAYRSAFSTQNDFPEDAIKKVDDMMDHILSNTVGFVGEDFDNLYQVYLTGKDNFRFDIAVTYPYKGNRKDTEKPTHLAICRDHLIKKYGAVVSENEEADDLIAIEATRLGRETIVASVDKDMLQIPCQHYNFNTGAKVGVSEVEGLRFVYKQMLTGDRADNIIGLYGYGPVKASKIVDHLDNELDMWSTVLDHYKDMLGVFAYDRLLENARLLWLRRYPKELWVPPTER